VPAEWREEMAGRSCAVLGDPIGHSLSPVLHRAGFAALGLDWSYTAQRVSSGGLVEFVDSLDESWRGLSLTMPLKREAMTLGGAVSSRAQLAGAANTLVLGRDGIALDNTDVPGAVAAVRERYDGPVDRAAILGGGATAASMVLALAELGCREATVHVRDKGRATTILEVARRLGDGLTVEIQDLDQAPVGDLLVSTVPATAQSPELIARCDRMPAIFDVGYHPWPTPLAASSADRVVVTGLDLLIHQAALQFEIFTKTPAPVAVMRHAGEGVVSEGT
jgi:shikimate dehydrogenase